MRTVTRRLAHPGRGRSGRTIEKAHDTLSLPAPSPATQPVVETGHSCGTTPAKERYRDLAPAAEGRRWALAGECQVTERGKRTVRRCAGLSNGEQGASRALKIAAFRAVCLTPVGDQVVHHGRVGQRRGVTQALEIALGNLAKDAPHDLARASLGQAGRELDHIGRRDRSDLLSDVGDKPRAKVPPWPRRRPSG